jgi:NADP-dependent aldehyde dehydrogenase
VRPRLFEVSATELLDRPDLYGTEAFGPMALVVRWDGQEQLMKAVAALEPSLAGTVYTATSGRDEELYGVVQPALAPRVGRLLDNKVPTGVAVVPAMHHGGPYPSTGHPAFTSVGIPESLHRFTARQAFDNVADAHLPPELQAANPLHLVRDVDGVPTTDPVDWETT